MNTTIERLLDAVDTVIAEHGPSGVTVRRVGEAAGLSHTAGAHHFGDKQGLFTAYITRAWERVADGLERATADVDDRAGLVEAAAFFGQFALDHRSEFSVMSRLELTDVDTPELWSARERGFFLLMALVERNQSAGWAAGREPLDVVATLWGFVHGFTDLWVGGPLWAPYDGNDLVPTLRRLTTDLVDSLAR